ncbi:MAG TPA: hypothetical protein VJ302_31570 [Blastocatellia bacterium]|nr:hypothetical protein [Blastocatellia bacterium]
MYIRRREGLGRLPTSYLYDAAITGVGADGLGAPPSGPLTVANLAGNLTNLVFWERNPSLRGKKLTAGSKAAAEWTQIFKSEVRPALHDQTQFRIGQLIFFSRYPALRGNFSKQPKDRQQKLTKEFTEIREKLVQPWLDLRIARGKVNSRTVFVIDNDAFRSLPSETRTRAGAEIASQFAFVKDLTVIFLDPGRFPEAFNLSDAVVGLTDPDTPPNVHVFWALKQQVNNLNRSIDALGGRQKFPAPTRTGFSPDRFGLASMSKFATPAGQTPQFAAPLMTSAVNAKDLIDYLNQEYVPEKSKLPSDRTRWTAQQKELVGIALGRAMAHEVRHLYVSNPVHAADGLGSSGARLFGQDAVFSGGDQTKILSSITALENQQGTKTVAASFAAAERQLDFPF